MSGTYGEGRQYRLKVCSSPTADVIHRHHGVVYTGSADEEIDIHNADGGLSFLFAGVVYDGWPYTERVGLVASTDPHRGTNVSVRPSEEWLTVARGNRNHCVAAEDISAGNLIMLTDEGDGATQVHDGMFSPVTTGTQGELDVMLGVAEWAADVAVSHDTHPWDWNAGDYGDEHPAFVAYIFR